MTAKCAVIWKVFVFCIHNLAASLSGPMRGNLKRKEFKEKRWWVSRMVDL